MKKLIVNAYTKAIKSKNGRIVKIYDEGKYWLWNVKQITLFDTASIIKLPENNFYYTDSTLFMNMVKYYEVLNNEIMVLFNGNILEQVVTEGCYAIWNEKAECLTSIKLKLDSVEITDEAILKFIDNTKMSAYIRKVTVASYQKVVMFINEKFERVLEEGVYYFWKNNDAIQVKNVDTRFQLMEVNGQELMSKDKATLRMNIEVQYQVEDVLKAVMDNKDYEKQLYVLVQLGLREIVSKNALDELLSNKELLAEMLKETLVDKIAQLGIIINNIGVKDIILPGDMREIMNQVLIAEKRAQANVITRREETASTRSLLNTAKLMEENEVLWKLKEMEFVEKIADKVNTISINGNGQILEQLKTIFVK